MNVGAGEDHRKMAKPSSAASATACEGADALTDIRTGKGERPSKEAVGVNIGVGIIIDEV